MAATPPVTNTPPTISQGNLPFFLTCASGLAFTPKASGFFPSLIFFSDSAFFSSLGTSFTRGSAFSSFFGTWIGFCGSSFGFSFSLGNVSADAPNNFLARSFINLAIFEGGIQPGCSRHMYPDVGRLSGGGFAHTRLAAWRRESRIDALARRADQSSRLVATIHGALGLE